MNNNISTLFPDSITTTNKCSGRYKPLKYIKEDTFCLNFESSVICEYKILNIATIRTRRDFMKLSHYCPDLSNYWTLRTERDLVI